MTATAHDRFANVLGTGRGDRETRPDVQRLTLRDLAGAPVVVTLDRDVVTVSNPGSGATVLETTEAALSQALIGALHATLSGASGNTVSFSEEATDRLRWAVVSRREAADSGRGPERPVAKP